MTDPERPVGPVLVAGAVGQAVAAAIRDENQQARIVDRGGYLRVAASGRCSVSRAAIERRLGRRFRLPGDLELVMASFAGRLTLSAERAEWDS